MKSSEMLNVGTTYSRIQLRQIFKITDATINTGIFIPRNYSSIWLFITQKMGKDRTQYSNNLERVLHNSFHTKNNLEISIKSTLPT